MSSSTSRHSLLGSLLGDRSFLAAAAILVIAIGCWGVAVSWLKISLRREAVPWPDHVKVDDGFRNTTFATTIGPYRRVEEDGVLDFDAKGLPVKDGLPDGEIVHKEQMLETLGMGTSLDKDNVGKRISNWYVSRVYEDTREIPQNSRDPRANSPYRYWMITVTYYTGGLDTVPHIPEVCWAAGGMTINDSSSVAVATAADAPWNGDVKWQRVLSSNREMRQFLVYYVFSLNGLPEESREQVRLKLMDPRLKHCYFAKIEISPRSPVVDAGEMDKRLKEFIKTSLPVVLKDLPTVQDIRKLAETK